MPKTLDAQHRLDAARTGAAVLCALQITDRTMRYGEFARATGIIVDGEEWQPWHRQQVPDVLRIIAAVEKQAGENTGSTALEFERIVNADGEPGAGVSKNTRIISE